MNQLATTITDPNVFEYDLEVYKFKVTFGVVDEKVINGKVHLSFKNVRLLDLINTLGYHRQISIENWKIVPMENFYVVIMPKLCWTRIRVIMNTKFILLQHNNSIKQASEVPWLVKCLPYNKKFEWDDHVTVSAGIDFLRYFYCARPGSTILRSFRPVCIYRLQLVKLVFKILARTFDVWKDSTADWANNENILPIIRPFVTAIQSEIYTPFMKTRIPKKSITVNLTTVEISKTPLRHFDAYGGAIAPIYASLFQYWTWLLTLEDITEMYSFFIRVYDSEVPLRIFRASDSKVRQNANRTMDERPIHRGKRKRVEYQLQRPLYLENPVERNRREEFYKHNCAVVYIVCIGYLRTRGGKDDMGRNPTNSLVAGQLLKIKEPISGDLAPLLNYDGKTVEYKKLFPLISTDAGLKEVDLRKNIFMK